MAALLLELLVVAVQSLGLGLTAMFPLAAPLIALLTLLITNERGYGTTMTKEVAQDQTSALQNTIQYNKAPNREHQG